jgi:hydrogenase maturation protease
MPATQLPPTPQPAPAASRAAQIIVIGVGTELRGDDGFGAAVIEALRSQPGLGGRVQLARCDGEPARMIDLWEGYRCALVVDAARGGSERYGFVYRRDLIPDAVPRPGRPGPHAGAGGEPGGNSHAAGLGSAVRLGQVLGRLPGRLILYAVHGRDFRLGASLSGPVAQAVPQLVNRISREVLGALPLGRRAEGPGSPRPGDPARVLSSRATLGT